MKLQDMLPRDSKDEGAEQLLAVGQKGSGKSTLIRRLVGILPKNHLTIVIDSKPDWPDVRRWWQRPKKNAKGPVAVILPHTHIRQLAPQLYVFRPEYPEWSDPRLTPILLGMMKRGHCTLVIDELKDLSRGTDVIPALGKIIRQGRSKHVRIMIGTQRPSAVPLIAITESVKVACFRLKSADDRKRMAQWVSPEMIKLPAGRHDFYWHDDAGDSDEPVLIKQPARARGAPGDVIDEGARRAAS